MEGLYKNFDTNEFRLNIQTKTFFGAWCNELVLENVLFYFRHSLGWLVCTPWFQSQKPSNFASEMQYRNPNDKYFVMNCKSKTKNVYCLFIFKEDPCEINDVPWGVAEIKIKIRLLLL